ncbi:DUF222 domain-containing protein [Fodinicola acaciae]|uniref:DUF222 domain-containing protein n=1 Tax=Fodinicola acaciae TaxID=2681555 RepID=UPI003CCCBB9E
MPISWEMLRDCLGVARAYEGLTISPETARRLACDADIIPVILNSEGVPLDVGRKERLAGPELRKALIARDKGCTRPGCTRPVRHTRSHHIVMGGRWHHMSGKLRVALRPPSSRKFTTPTGPYG